MDQVIERDVGPDTIEATLNYMQPDGEVPFTYTGGPGSTEVRTGGTFDARRVTIHNGRREVERFTLERDGFHFIPHDTRMVDFLDDAEVKRTYYAEMEALIARESGASRVVVFDHTVRTADREVGEAKKIREVVQRVHNDYTEWSGPQRVRDILPDEAETLFKRRFAIIQAWRPIRHPVETFPLAICEATSMTPEDLVISERRYPNRIGQTYVMTYSDRHRWVWFPRMRRDEALVFKVYDSLKDGRARWTAHTAFDDETAPPTARPRESIEIRTLAFF